MHAQNKNQYLIQSLHLIVLQIMRYLYHYSRILIWPFINIFINLGILNILKDS